MIDAALQATWPPAAFRRLGAVTLRDGAGGGRRVSAATLDGPLSAADINAAAKSMRDAGQRPVFRVLGHQTDLDAHLAAEGYAVVDPTLFMAAPVAALAAPPRPISLFSLWPPLAIQTQIWAEAGIGPARLAIMDRVTGAKSAFVARVNNRAAGVAFVALHGSTAMLHALEILPDVRRQGVGRLMVTGMAHWAQAQGADTLALAVTQANSGARALYTTLGMAQAEGYHYREAPR